MKQLFILFTLTIFFNLNSFAQYNSEINEIFEYMSQGENPGFEVAIADADPAEVESNLKKYLKKANAKVKTSRKSVEMFADNAKIPEVSENTIDIYAITETTSYGTRVKAFADLGGAYISSRDHEIAFFAFQNFLGEFVLQERKRMVENELDEQEDVLKDLEKELDSQIKDYDKFKKEIEKAKAVIDKRQSDVNEAIRMQETTRAKVSIQEEIIETINAKRQTLEYR